MAFEIGQRITSDFTGDGTVVGELFRDSDRVCFQRIEFDNPTLGARDYQIRRLTPLEIGDDAAPFES